MSCVHGWILSSGGLGISLTGIIWVFDLVMNQLMSIQFSWYPMILVIKFIYSVRLLIWILWPWLLNTSFLDYIDLVILVVIFGAVIMLNSHKAHLLILIRWVRVRSLVIRVSLFLISIVLPSPRLFTIVWTLIIPLSSSVTFKL